MNTPDPSKMPFEGNTVIGNDRWIGRNAVILPGVHVGDGAIIGTNSVVGSDVATYTIVIGNPAKVLRKHSNDEPIGLSLKVNWRNKSIEEINSLIPLLTCSDLERVKTELKLSTGSKANSSPCGKNSSNG